MIASKSSFEKHIADTSGFFRISVDDYHDMIDKGILGGDDRVELLNGFLVQKMPQNTPHSVTILKLTKLLLRKIDQNCRDQWSVRPQLPIRLENSEPEPDLAIVRGDDNSFATKHPTATDFGIVIEVANTSLAIDRGGKLEIYAEAGIPEYWIVNLINKQIEVYSQPEGVSYRQQRIYSLSDSCPIILDGVPMGDLKVSDLILSS